ncbi:MAG: ATP-binding protein [Acidobacteriota bacterium]
MGRAAAPAAPILRLDRLVGNDEIRTLLGRAVAEKRLLPSLLFSGPVGVGKLSTARALAASLNCLSPEGIMACETCVACHKIATWNHPDVKVLESEASARAASRPLFYPVGAADGARVPASRAGNRLLIGQVRHLVRDTAYRPFEARWRVLIVRDVETDPGQGCANVLLKILEEPPTRTIFVVVTPQPERLPDTVPSRCHTLSFVPAPVDEVTKFLIEHGLDADEAHWRAVWTGGCPGAARRLDSSSRRASRDALVEALTVAADADAATAATVAEPFGRRGVDLLATLDDLALVARDLMIWRADPDLDLLANRDRLAEMETLAASIPPDRGARLLDRIAWCGSAASRHVNPSLMWQMLFLLAGGHLRDAPLSAPLQPALPGEEPIP